MLALLALACSPARRAGLAKVHDLVDLFPLAEVHREEGTIDIGSAAARPHLASGWYPNERGKDGSTFAWSRGEVSVVELFLAAPRALRVELRCEPLLVAGRPQAVSLALNGRPLGSRELAPGMHGYGFDLPRSVLKAGTNRLAFRYRLVSAPGRDNGRRRLAVRWDALRFLPLSPAAAPPRVERGALYLPFGTGVVYYLDLPAAGELALSRVERRGAAGGYLAVSAQEEGGRAERHAVEPGRGERTVELPGRGERLVRLALRAVAAGSDTAGAGDGLLLAAPAVLAVSGGWGERGSREPPAASAVSEPPPRPSSSPNVLVYLVDTLRADRLGCYGAAKPVSPALDAFARGATLFARAIAQSTWTRPAVTSLLTGLGPLAHGVQTLDDRLPERATTLPERLHAAGYRSAAFSTNPQVSAGTGLAQGFDDFDLRPEDASSAAVNRRVLRWLDRGRGDAPFFLYVHTIDPHAPYAPTREMRRRFAPALAADAGSRAEVVRAYAARGAERARRMAQLSTLYDAEVAGNDRSFGELLAELRRRGLYDSTLVVFVADHGEEFDEHGDLGHGNNLYAQTLQVPLVVRWPGQERGERVTELAQQVDLFPTILAAAGLPPPAGLPGIDLAALAGTHGTGADRARPPGRRGAFSHLSYEGRVGVSLVEGGWKLILPLSSRFGAGPELYRLDVDPAERVNLAERDEVRAGWLLARIRRELLVRGGRPAERAPVDEETRRALGALGYL